jgi:maltooligosyltrehalose trehalohydrolase
VPPHRFVVCTQNHDQVGNRMLGDRLTTHLPFEARKLAAASILLSPFVPMLFMGEEYGETAPFQYFIDHTDPELVEAVRRGRREEFATFGWQEEPPDPYDEATFRRSTLDHSLREHDEHRALEDFHRELLRLRRELAPIASGDAIRDVLPMGQERTIVISSRSADREALTALHFGADAAEVALPLSAGRWRKVFDSAEDRWRGPGATTPDSIHSEGVVRALLGPYAGVLFVKEQ